MMKQQVKSFGYAFEGIFEALKTESHLRFHFVAAFYTILFAALGDFTPAEWVALIITVSLVIFAELVNTALEEVCDLYTTEIKSSVKRIKDVSAGAVLVLALGAVVSAVFLFLVSGHLQTAFDRLLANPLWFIPLSISAVLSVLFVGFYGRNYKQKKNK